MATFSVESYEFEQRDDRNLRAAGYSERFAKMATNGLNMAKKRNNFKEVCKAAERLKQKLKGEALQRRKEKSEKREKVESEKWMSISKEQARKEQRKQTKKMRKEERRKEKMVKRCLEAEEEREINSAIAAKKH
mmetsp:Transcript_23708/g.27268  ORF Transcript_23708/g.27268 Transcript_23708/m.27268 type:complete len:134 (-) Transcript_23708:81-482(-)